MDKTKYNRASKDPSQLQQFIDEVCEGGVIGDSITINAKSPDGEDRGTAILGYSAGEDGCVVSVESDEGYSVIYNGWMTLRFASSTINIDCETQSIYGSSYTGSFGYNLARPGGVNGEYIQTITDPQNVAYFDIGRSYVKDNVATVDLSNYFYKIVIMRKAQISAEEILLLFPKNHTRACCVSGDSFTAHQCAPEKIDGDDNQVTIRLDATVLTDEDEICVDLTNPVFCKLSITRIGH